MNKNEIAAVVTAVLKAMGTAPINPTTVPALTAKAPRMMGGPRIHYTLNPKARVKVADLNQLSPRLKSVYAAIAKGKHGLASKQIEEKVGINRNAVSGAVFQLRNMGLITTTEIK